MYPQVYMYNRKQDMHIEFGSIYGFGHPLGILECISHRDGEIAQYLWLFIYYFGSFA